MKIAILIPSRGRPRMLSAAITCLHELASGEHEIEYRVGFDEDDDLTYVECRRLGILDCCFQGGKGILTIGEIWNRLAGLGDADIYSCMIDDAFPISPHWDKEMVRITTQYDAVSWYEVSAPQNVGYPTCTKKWLDMVGYMVPEHFPFWFSDTWYCEMVQFITNHPVPVSTLMSLYSKQEKTQNLRDLDFWWGFFCATRIIRLREAHAIVGGDFEEFKLSRKMFIDAGLSRDMEFRGEKIAGLEASRASGEPSAKYLLAKKRAEEYLEKNSLTIWS